MRVCRGVLIDPHDTQDAFQATFLVLVKSARTLWVRDSLGPWLHQVAYRTASCARLAAARRRRHERCAAQAAKDVHSEDGDELGRVLHEEIERLPERFRAPLVLCDLEGRTHEQAARHLGWPIGTVKSRQSRGRERLRQRLIRRGLGSHVGPIGAGLIPDGATTLIPPALVESTTNAVIQFINGTNHRPRLCRVFSTGGSQIDVHNSWLKVASVLFVIGASVSGVGLLVQNAASSTQPPPEGDHKAARTDNLPVLEVKPGKFSVTVVERGSLESSEIRTRIAWSRALRPSSGSCPKARGSKRATSSASSTRPRYAIA